MLLDALQDTYRRAALVIKLVAGRAPPRARAVGNLGELRSNII